MQSRKVDSKGRLLLGAAWADKICIIDEKNSNEIILKKAAVIPENELWLYKNEEAINSLIQGLEQAKHKTFAPDPTANKNMSWLDDIED